MFIIDGGEWGCSKRANENENCDLHDKRRTLVMARPSQRSPSAKQSAVGQCENRCQKTCLVDIDNLGIHYFTLEGLHDDGSIPCLKLCLTCRWDDLAFTYVCYGNDRDDIPILHVSVRAVTKMNNIPMFTATRSFNILIKLLTEIVFKLGTKVGWMK